MRKDDVFIKRDEFSQRFRRESLRENSIRRAVAVKDSVRHEPIGCALGFDLIGGLAKGESFGLSKDVSHEDVMVLPEWVKRFCERNEVTRD